jgi:putative Holliday junction resolvase
MTGPILGLDLGTRRMGLAISDPEASIAFPAGFLLRKGLARDLEALCALAAQRDVSRIVIGLPLHLNGSSGQAAQAARDFARALADATALPVETLDERWTSVEAERALRDAPRGKRRRRKEVVDAMAATLILRTYLEIQHGRAPRGDEV